MAFGYRILDVFKEGLDKGSGISLCHAMKDQHGVLNVIGNV